MKKPSTTPNVTTRTQRIALVCALAGCDVRTGRKWSRGEVIREDLAASLETGARTFGFVDLIPVRRESGAA